MADDKLLLNDGSSFVLLNDGTSVVLLNGAAVAPQGLTISGTHATVGLFGREHDTPVEFTFILKANILNKFESIFRIKCPLRVEVKSNIKLKSPLLVESRSPFEFKSAFLIQVKEKVELLATLPMVNVLTNILRKEVKNDDQEKHDAVQEAERKKIMKLLLDKLSESIKDDE